MLTCSCLCVCTDRRHDVMAELIFSSLDSGLEWMANVAASFIAVLVRISVPNPNQRHSENSLSHVDDSGKSHGDTAMCLRRHPYIQMHTWLYMAPSMQLPKEVVRHTEPYILRHAGGYMAGSRHI